MKLKRLAQSTILITSQDGKTILVDPGKYNLEPGLLTLETFPTADIIVITHKHADHYDLSLVKAMLSRSKAFILTNSEIHEFLKRESIDSKIINVGESLASHGFNITAIRTDHFVRDENIINFGIVVSGDGSSIYHTSDTRYIEPSLLPSEINASCVLVPISNRGVVMGIDDALVFCSELKSSIIIPVHYDSPKDKDRVNPNEFEKKGESIGLNIKILKFGQELEI